MAYGAGNHSQCHFRGLLAVPAFAVYLIMDGKYIVPPHPIKHALVGAAIGLILGLLFAFNLKTNKKGSVRCTALP